MSPTVLQGLVRVLLGQKAPRVLVQGFLTVLIVGVLCRIYTGSMTCRAQQDFFGVQAWVRGSGFG